MIEKFLNDNSLEMRLLRTIVQGLLAVLIGSLAIIVGKFNLSAEAASAMTATIMCVLSPIMALLKNSEKIETED